MLPADEGMSQWNSVLLGKAEQQLSSPAAIKCCTSVSSSGMLRLTGATLELLQAGLPQ